MKPQPEVHIRGDLAARYEAWAVLYACQRAGITHRLHHRTPAPGG